MTATTPVMPANPEPQPRTPWFDQFIEDVMVRNPAIVQANDSLGAVQATMNRAGVGHLPVLELGRPVGMVTARDLARSMVVPITVLTRQEIENLLAGPVRWTMSRPLISLPPQTPVRVAIRLMMSEDVGSVAVVDPDDGKLLGLVTRSAILQLVARSV
jgi:CBS domain-containing protein